MNWINTRYTKWYLCYQNEKKYFNKKKKIRNGIKVFERKYMINYIYKKSHLYSFQDTKFHWAGMIIKGGFNFVNINEFKNSNVGEKFTLEFYNQFIFTKLNPPLMITPAQWNFNCILKWVQLTILFMLFIICYFLLKHFIPFLIVFFC